MLDLFQETIKGYNLPFTILLGFVILYWIIAMVGIVDLDGGGDLDIDVDTDTDGIGEGGTGNALADAIRFLGFSDAPLILVLSIFSIILWVCNMLANMYFNPAESGSRASLLLIPVIISGFIITRLLVRPLRPVMGLLKDTEPPAKIIGEQGIVTSTSLSETFGRIQVDFEGKPLILNAVASEGSGDIEKGAAVLVVSKKEKEATYIVRPL